LASYFINTGELRSALIWDITWRVVVISYRRFRSTYLEDGIDGLPRNVCNELPLYAA